MATQYLTSIAIHFGGQRSLPPISQGYSIRNASTGSSRDALVCPVVRGQGEHPHIEERHSTEDLVFPFPVVEIPWSHIRSLEDAGPPHSRRIECPELLGTRERQRVKNHGIDDVVQGTVPFPRRPKPRAITFSAGLFCGVKSMLFCPPDLAWSAYHFQTWAPANHSRSHTTRKKAS
jgi:hypothetical protein